MTSLSIVIPAHDEEEGIVRVLTSLQRLALPSLDVIVVDDASTDATAERAEALGARVVRHPCRTGYGRCLKDGIREARHEFIGITDADGTYPVDQLPLLLRTLDQGYDMVVGARTGPAYRGTLLKVPARLIFRLLAEFTAGRRIPDINSGLRVFRRRDVLPLFPHLCEGFSFTTTLTLIYLLTTKLVAYVPIVYEERIGRSKVRWIHDSLQTLQYLVQVISVYNPLKIFLLLVLLLLGVGTGFLVAGMVRGSSTLLVLAALSFLSSILVFSLGLLAELLRWRMVAMRRGSVVGGDGERSKSLPTAERPPRHHAAVEGTGGWRRGRDEGMS